MKNEKPILFSGEMVRAILEGRKTQTRRFAAPASGSFPLSAPNFKYGNVGDRLWVRETWRTEVHTGEYKMIGYRANDTNEDCRPATNLSEFNRLWEKYQDNGWRPSIFMPRWASRITLEITAVRVERLKDISEVDAKAEGITPRQYRDDTFWTNYLKGTKPKGGVDGEVIAFRSPIESYSSLWNSINGAGSWDANPWVWVIEFKKI